MRTKNIHELEEVIRHAVLTAGSKEILPIDLRIAQRLDPS